MRKVSSKEAERGFFGLLAEADGEPVIIARHQRPRAVLVSWRRFQIYEKALAFTTDALAAQKLEEALQHTGEGRLGRANKAMRAAVALAEPGVEIPE